MAHYLPPAIMQFFQPRPPLEHKEPITRKRKMPPLQGVSQYVMKLKESITTAPPVVLQETATQKIAKRKAKRQGKWDSLLKHAMSKWDPKALDSKDGVTKDAYKTLFVGRLSYGVTADDLKSEFEYYGPVVSVQLIKDKKGKSRGYAFVEFESSKDLKEAYKDADGRKIRERRIVVDVERGRTVKNWRPRRLAGGLGGTRLGGKDQNQRYSGRQPDPNSSSSGSSSSTSSYIDHDRDRAEPRGRSRDRDRERDRSRERRKEHRSRSRDKGKDKEHRSKRSRSPRRHSRSRSRSSHRRWARS